MLDRLVKSEDTRERYNAWSDYRKDLTNYIMESVHDSLIKNKLMINRERRLKEEYNFDTAINEFISVEKRKPSLAIWGAGGCNDIDIKALSKYFTLVLIDRDIQMIEYAREKNCLSKEVCKCVDIKFFDISYDSYQMLEAMLKDDCDICEIKEYIQEIISTKESCMTSDIPHFDYSVAVGLSSQLTARLCALLAEYDRLTMIEDVIKEITGNAVNDMMECIISLTDRLIITGYELYSAEDDMGKFEQEKLELCDALYVVGEETEYESCILGNEFLVATIRMLIKKNIIYRPLKRAILIWPFTHKKNYMMHIMSMEKVI